ncbi:MAG: hypothetical protein NTY17_09105 [Planctomycetia bacterium]|nr:hypothetical protein [Planctomycetia bacterium]
MFSRIARRCAASFFHAVSSLTKSALVASEAASASNSPIRLASSGCSARACGRSCSTFRRASARSGECEPEAGLGASVCFRGGTGRGVRRVHREHRLERLHAGRRPLLLVVHGRAVVAFEGREPLVAPRSTPSPSFEEIEVEREFEVTNPARPRVVGMRGQKAIHLVANVTQIAMFVVGNGDDPVMQLVGRWRLHEEPDNSGECDSDDGCREPLPQELPTLLATLLLGGGPLEFRDGGELISLAAIDLCRRRSHIGGPAGVGRRGSRRGCVGHDAPACEVLRDGRAASHGPGSPTDGHCCGWLLWLLLGRRWRWRWCDRCRKVLGGGQQVDLVEDVATGGWFPGRGGSAWLAYGVDGPRGLVAPLVGRWPHCRTSSR